MNTKQQLRLDVEDFLFEEANLIDRWQLDDWLKLYAAECRYEIAPTGEENAEQLSPDDTLFILADNRYRLEARVKRIQKKTAWVEYPHSRTRHMISNVQILSSNESEVQVQANFIVYRTKRNVTTQFPGHYNYVLRPNGNGFLIKSKRAILDLDALVPQGRVGFIL